MPKDSGSISRLATRTLSSLLFGKIVITIFSGLSFIFIARLLGPHNYGLYTLAVGFSTLIGAMNHFGVGSYFNKFLAEAEHFNDRKKLARVVASGYAVLFPAAILLTLIAVAISGFMANTYFKTSGIAVSSLVLVSFTIFFAAVSGATYAALVGLSKGWEASLSYIVQYISQFAISVLLIYLGFGVNGAIIGLLASYILSFSASFYYLSASTGLARRLRLPKPTKEDLKEVVYYAFPVAFNNVLVLGMTSFGISMLGIFSTAYVIGNYGAANGVIVLMLVVSGTISTVLIPMFSRAMAGKNDSSHMHKVYNKALFFSLLLALPIMAVIGVLSKPMIELFITRNYASAPLYVTLITLGAAINLISSYTQNFFMAKGQVMKMLKYDFVVGALQVAAIVILIKPFDVMGVIMGIYYVGPIAATLLFATQTRKLFGVKLEAVKMSKVYIASLLLALVLSSVFIINNSILQLLLGAVLAIAVYPIILAFMHVVNDEVLSELEDAASGIRFISPVLSCMISYTRRFMATTKK